MEGHQSKCNYCIHALFRCSHSPSCAFKSQCENRTLTLLQRFVGLVLLELFELSSCAFSQSGNFAFCIFFKCMCLFNTRYVCVRTWMVEIQSTNSEYRHHTWPHIMYFPFIKKNLLDYLRLSVPVAQW